MKHPSEVVPNDILLWKDRLRTQKKSTATAACKLSVVRSFFEYLRAAGGVPLNPASTKLVSPPELPSEPTGRALLAKEVRYLLLGPDKEKAEGARDYAPMIVMLRLSLRVSEVCSLSASSVKWRHGRWTLRCKVKGGRSEPKVRLENRTKGARLSLARVGSYYWQEMSTRLRLTACFVREHLPPPRLRVFKWLTAPQK